MCIFVEIERIYFSCSFLVAVLILPHDRNAGSFVPAGNFALCSSDIPVAF